MSTVHSVIKRDCKYTDGYFCYAIPIPAVAGITVGCGAFVLALIFTAFCCIRARRLKKRRKEEEEENKTLELQYSMAAQQESNWV